MQTSAAKTDQKRAEKVNILLVDDKPARLLSYQSVLSPLGQHLVCVNSGVEALQQLMQREFAVILLDVSMPGMDGFEVAGLIHQHPRYERTPIIFVTGIHISELDRLKGYKLGAVDYVSIPIVPEILRSKVSVLVELHCQRKKLQELNASLAAANARLEQANSTLQEEKNRELEVLNLHLSEANRELARANVALLTENRQRMQMENKLKDMDRQKDEFLAILAHELRNPLAPIQHAVDVMKNHDMQDKVLLWSRDVIGRQLTHLSQLVDDLLDISRITHGTINLDKRPIRISTIVERAIEATQPVISAHGHQLSMECPEPSPTVHGDPVRLVQVLSNLLHNAAKYTPDGGAICVAVEAGADSVTLKVRDSGVGIAPESVSRLFTLFSQIRDQRSAYESGLGVGLALVKRLVELHDGNVTVRSGGLNAGSEFIVTLPTVVAAEPALEDEDEAPARYAPPRTVLVADDNRDALEGLAILLEMGGHRVIKASDGAEALELAARYKPDVVILDIGMPVMDGYQLARHLRTEPWSQHMRLIAVSGWGQGEDVRCAHEAGFDFHLVKPATFEAITDLMARMTHAAV